MSLFEKIWSFGGAITGVIAIEFAALIAFCITCVPAGFIATGTGNDGEVAFDVVIALGGIAAAATAVYMTYHLLTRTTRVTRRAGKL
jgi:hypothetical protein